VGRYLGRRVAFLTQHGKEKVVAPTLEAAFGCQVAHVTGYDTDLLGTFTRDIPRAGNQIEAARKKARLGMQLSGLPLGLASEGSFGPDPMVGMFPWNVELLVFLDDERGLELVGVAQGKANFAHVLAADWAAAEAFARQAGFPAHHLVVRPESEDDPRIHKGIAAWTELEAVFAWALAESANGRVFVETDVRAHANPTRMHNIRLAAEDLVKKLDSSCPACGTPGFWLVERVTGLPCGDCGAPTRETRAEVHGCLKCAHRETRERPDPQYADPGRCDYCNP
jgi:ribosomal protein S27AE